MLWQSRNGATGNNVIMPIKHWDPWGKKCENYSVAGIGGHSWNSINVAERRHRKAMSFFGWGKTGRDGAGCGEHEQHHGRNLQDGLFQIASQACHILVQVRAVLSLIRMIELNRDRWNSADEAARCESPCFTDTTESDARSIQVIETLAMADELLMD